MFCLDKGQKETVKLKEPNFKKQDFSLDKF